MDHEYEVAMRVDFARWQALLDSPFPIETEAELEQRIHADEIELRWSYGPHSAHWRYLDDAHQDWAARPETMTRFLDGITQDRTAGYFVGVTDIEYRSQCQARDLTEAERARKRDRPPRQRGR
ncbi:hypothetical protein [Nocardia vulneris]|uniref:Uncharacterized protein n=1 Tax=Nocardia vulneris TaxID=1141657 RepID=A0ABR4Z5H9_9NOCA|nr:hypothetical protein [Nocardia vulneris]KIA60551.1 hypothetical protein FG87_36130 [Nocardia vulneris]